MGYDELCAFRDCLGRAVRRHGEARHDPACIRRAFTEQQTHIVPFGGQRRRGEAFQESHHGGDGWHELIQ